MPPILRPPRRYDRNMAGCGHTLIWCAFAGGVSWYVIAALLRAGYDSLLHQLMP